MTNAGPRDNVEHPELVALEPLDELTRGFAARQVGLLDSVCDALKEDSSDPAQRRAGLAAGDCDSLSRRAPRLHEGAEITRMSCTSRS